MKDKRRFKIGDWVKVVATVSGETSETIRTITRKLIAAKSFGQIVGLSCIQEGTIKSTPYDPEGLNDGNYLQIEKRHDVWLIRFGMINRPVKVLDDDVVSLPAEEKTISQLPLSFQVNPWVEQQDYREMMQETMRGHPRDSRGKWMPLSFSQQKTDQRE